MIRINKLKEDFVVLNITDLQVSDNDWENSTENLKIFINTLNKLISKTNPDLITVSGDLSYAGQYKSYECIAQLLDSYKIPWAPVWGNHDNQGGVDVVNKQVEILKESPYLVYEEGNPDIGNGNYTIAICENDVIVYGIIMMDSHDRMEYVDESGDKSLKWAHLYPNQLNWYKEQIKLIGGAKSMLITHIPIYAYNRAIEAAWNKEYDRKSISPTDSANEKYWNDGYKTSFGVCHEAICSYPSDEGMFDVIKELGSTDTVLVGHDHVNNFVISFNDINLAYGLKTGAGCYWDPKLSGGTVVRISKRSTEIEHIYVEV